MLFEHLYLQSLLNSSSLLFSLIIGDDFYLSNCRMVNDDFFAFGILGGQLNFGLIFDP